ncbi:hypothetical protein DSO57_1006210 [Entomophthora muscae]|uniref:Uncharacterized protein n=1 Tax=Entomophthora muscae TaxID=34485 RepID=A0ACC2S9V8_9FUNG|nr:hypothetical protein DSO57_1006210 [Entomophthora muscae]
MIIRQMKNLTQTGTVKELTRANEELRLCSPADMAFDTPATHLMYYGALKSHLIRHINLDQVTNLQSLYHKAEKEEQTSNTPPKHRLGRERPKDSHSTGSANCLPPGNNNNSNHNPAGSNGHRNGNNGCDTLTTMNEDSMLVGRRTRK